MNELHTEILACLPYLRRHARALTGTRHVGDEYVRMCLEVVVQEPQRIDPAAPKLSLFRILHEIWSELQAAIRAAEVDRASLTRTQIERSLRDLPPTDRAALLLTTVEDFSPAQAGRILELSPQAVKQKVGRAQRALRRGAPASVLIIEDELLIGTDLKHSVEEMGHRVFGPVAGHRDAVELARRTRPSLVLADVELQDGENGIAAVREILDLFATRVVFITAYPERLAAGARIEPTLVVPKPFTPSMLKVMVGRALSAAAPSAQAS